MNPQALPSPTTPLHVLTLTPFYPHGDDDAYGCFVSEPLPWLENIGINNTVCAVQPLHRRRKPNGKAPTADYYSHFALPGNLGLPTSGRFLFARILEAVRRKHQRHSIDLIHAHAPLPCGHAAALLRRELGIPYVVSVHGLDAYSNTHVPRLTGLWCERTSRMVYSRAERVICISEHVRHRVSAKAGPRVLSCVVHNGVDPKLFAPAYDSGTAAPVVLSIGNLIPSKGHDLLIRAVASLKTRYPDLSCAIIGDGPERDRLSHLANQLEVADRIRFLGRKNRRAVAEALRRCTVFVLPSGYEGLGCVYLEAMATAKPAIGCRGQGIEEVIRHKVNGCLIEPGNLEELVSTIAELLCDEPLRRRLGDAARRTVLQGLTLAHQAERLGGVYRECLA